MTGWRSCSRAACRGRAEGPRSRPATGRELQADTGKEPHGHTQIVAGPGIPQIVVTREFRARRELLFRAHTDPELLVQWLGPRKVRMAVDHLDARDGGIWRYTHYLADGEAHAFHGVYHGTPSPDGIVQTSSTSACRVTSAWPRSRSPSTTA